MLAWEVKGRLQVVLVACGVCSQHHWKHPKVEVQVESKGCSWREHCFPSGSTNICQKHSRSLEAIALNMGYWDIKVE